MAKAQKMMSRTAKEKMVAIPVARQMIIDRMPSLGVVLASADRVRVHEVPAKPKASNSGGARSSPLAVNAYTRLVLKLSEKITKTRQGIVLKLRVWNSSLRDMMAAVLEATWAVVVGAWR